MTALITFAALSLIASALVLSACMLSSVISRNEDGRNGCEEGQQ